MDLKKVEEFKTKMMSKKNLMVENLKVKNFNDIIPKIEDGVLYNLVTKKNINPYAFVLDAINKFGEIEELYIVTYRVSEKAANNFSYMIKEKLVKKMVLLVNDNYEVLMKGKQNILIDLEKEHTNFKLLKANSHAKITLIKSNNDYIVISGSGNYSNNPKIEQYTILKDKKLFNFHKGWILNG